MCLVSWYNAGVNEGKGSQLFREAIGLVNSGLELMSAQDVDPLPADVLGFDIALLQRAVGLLQLQSARRVRRFDQDGGYAASGSATAVDWLRDQGLMSTGSAVKQVKLARQLEELQSTVEAVESGQVGFEHALEVASATADLGAAVETELLETAVAASPEEVRGAARGIRQRELPLTGEAEAERQRRRRRLRIYETPSGMTALEGELPQVAGQRLRLCLESLIGIPQRGDGRSQEQRQADALEELCRRQLALGKLPALGGRKPQVTVVVQAETLAGVAGAEPARLEGSGALALSALRELFGESALRLAVEGAGGVTLSYGRARRLHSETQRLERATRYATCAIERCTRKARQCQLHHLDPWQEGGGTDAAEGVPLCHRHHRLLDDGWRLEAAGGGRYRLQRAWTAAATAPSST